MNVPCYNTILANEHLRDQDRRDAEAPAEVRALYESLMESIDKYDVSETLCCEAMVEAFKTGNVDLIGRVSLFLMKAYCHRAAVIQVYEAEPDFRKDEAKAMEMVQAFKEGK